MGDWKELVRERRRDYYNREVEEKVKRAEDDKSVRWRKVVLEEIRKYGRKKKWEEK